jgi:hypothetical protein
MTTSARSTRLVLCAATIGLGVACTRHPGTPVIERRNMPATEVCASAGVDSGACPKDVVVAYAALSKPADEADLSVARSAVAHVVGALEACDASPAPKTSFSATLASGLEPVLIATIKGERAENECLRSRLVGLTPRQPLLLMVEFQQAN